MDYELRPVSKTDNEVEVEKGSLTEQPQEALPRHLKARHLSMITIGGTIGTGLFLASGNSIAQAGPGGALVAYGSIGIMVYFLMTSLGEMATYMPVSGSFNTYGSRFVDPAFGFALGWNYWYVWTTTIAVELSASSVIVRFWLPNVPSFIWSLIILVIIMGLNCISVKGYGESEYWFSMIKVITVVIFVIIGILVAAGVLGGKTYGFSNYTIGEAPFRNGFGGVVSVFLVAGFSFQGSEMVGITAGESSNPEKNIPKAVKQIFWRILLFYILSIFVIGLLIPYNDPKLMEANENDPNAIAQSPFTLGFEMAGLGPAPSIMNAVILTTILSAGNSGVYAASRTLWVLANEKKAPRFLRKVTKNGIPIYALLFTCGFSCITFLSSLFGDKVVYNWLLSSSGVAGFVAWFGIAFNHWRFRRAFLAQGKKLSDLPYRAKFYPFGPILACVCCIIVIFGQAYFIITQHPFQWTNLLANYIGVIGFIILFFGYKIVHKTKLVPLMECDFSRLNVQ
ncbi:hypothetical protein K7432_001887 [Basidiobolus ranarum]|uniref:Amino acid permease/ SLC12A domain-containing protein n=1 Tax=Basidiobolus ranarum TaxID=34480 RepID=A0ABR2X2B9_9FUNG